MWENWAQKCQLTISKVRKFKNIFFPFAKESVHTNGFKIYIKLYKWTSIPGMKPHTNRIKTGRCSLTQWITNLFAQCLFSGFFEILAFSWVPFYAHTARSIQYYYFVLNKLQISSFRSRPILVRFSKGENKSASNLRKYDLYSVAVCIGWFKVSLSCTKVPFLADGLPHLRLARFLLRELQDEAISKRD